jgi:hypothetical protein
VDYVFDPDPSDESAQVALVMAFAKITTPTLCRLLESMTAEADADPDGMCDEEFIKQGLIIAELEARHPGVLVATTDMVIAHRGEVSMADLTRIVVAVARDAHRESESTR